MGTGALLWILRTRPDFAAEVSELKRADAAPTHGDRRKPNATMRKFKESTGQCLHLRKVSAGVTKRKLVVFADASFNARNESKSSSKIGYVVLLAPDNDNAFARNLSREGGRARRRQTRQRCLRSLRPPPRIGPCGFGQPTARNLPFGNVETSPDLPPPPAERGVQAAPHLEIPAPR